VSRHNIYRGGRVHVMERECDTCIFRPKDRFVPGARVAEMVRETTDDGATVVCHATLIADTDNAVCRGWWDRLADKDATCRLAVALELVEYDAVPAK
jgi:hypothetical protein